VRFHVQHWQKKNWVNCILESTAAKSPVLFTIALFSSTDYYVDDHTWNVFFEIELSIKLGEKSQLQRIRFRKDTFSVWSLVDP
jgi:hypothetical protein